MPSAVCRIGNITYNLSFDQCTSIPFPGEQEVELSAVAANAQFYEWDIDGDCKMGSTVKVGTAGYSMLVRLICKSLTGTRMVSYQVTFGM